MAEQVRVGLLDSGIGDDLSARVGAAAAFIPIDDDAVERGAAEPDRLGHGSALASVIVHHAPEALLLNAQVLGPRGTTSAAAVAAGLDWLVAEKGDIVTLSLGLSADRAVLRKACAAALAAGCVLLGAAPARGAPVFPSAYEGVIRVTGDARCAADQISYLDTAQADFGACVRGPIAGASVAVGHACGLLAAEMARAKRGGTDVARETLAGMAVFHGPERKSADDVR
jgi:hypothetical protein